MDLLQGMLQASVNSGPNRLPLLEQRQRVDVLKVSLSAGPHSAGKLDLSNSEHPDIYPDGCVSQ